VTAGDCTAVVLLGDRGHICEPFTDRRYVIVVSLEIELAIPDHDVRVP